MKIESIKIKNFRSYKEETVISFDELTVLVSQIVRTVMVTAKFRIR